MKLVILGAGESGTGTAFLAKKKGCDVFVSDKGNIKEKYKDVLSKNRIEWEEGKHTIEKILLADEVVKSPGIPDKAEVVQKLRERGIPVISEIEFACRYTNATIIGITGTNGKTTTTSLTYHILKKAGFNVGLGGNIGKSFAELVAEHDYQYYVLELSNFQLDGMYRARVNIAILLNITPDHLDRYASYQDYIDSKFRIIQNQEKTDSFIYWDDDPVIKAEIKKRHIKVRKFPFSINHEIAEGAYVKDEYFFINIHNNPITMSIHQIALQGNHNLFNTMASTIVARVLELKKEVIREALSDFQSVEHRMEPVATVHGIEFINDSKATNVNSAWYALESIHKPVIWIAGGQDKGNDYTMMRALVKQKVKAIICLGKDNRKIHDAFGDIITTIVDTTTAADAVSAAFRLGQNGDVALLSPACASFDLFKDYEDRGNQFKASVRAL